jgi:hypothetical protein
MGHFKSSSRLKLFFFLFKHPFPYRHCPRIFLTVSRSLSGAQNELRLFFASGTFT